MWKDILKLQLQRKKKKENKNIAAGFAFTKASYLLQLDFSLFQSVLYKKIQKDRDSTYKWTRALNQKSKPEDISFLIHAVIIKNKRDFDHRKTADFGFTQN